MRENAHQPTRFIDELCESRAPRPQGIRGECCRQFCAVSSLNAARKNGPLIVRHLTEIVGRHSRGSAPPACEWRYSPTARYAPACRGAPPSELRRSSPSGHAAWHIMQRVMTTSTTSGCRRLLGDGGGSRQIREPHQSPHAGRGQRRDAEGADHRSRGGGPSPPRRLVVIKVPGV